VEKIVSKESIIQAVGRLERDLSPTPSRSTFRASGPSWTRRGCTFAPVRGFGYMLEEFKIR